MTTAAVDALRRAAALGPYFAVRLDQPLDDGWLPLDALVDGPTAAERVEHARAVIASRSGMPIEDVDLRACASITFLGIVSRLVAPALAAAALDGVVPQPGSVRWQPVDGGPIPTAWADVTGASVTDADAAATALLNGVVSDLVAPLEAAFARGFALSGKVLWGNVASALGGAAGMIVRADVNGALDPTAIVAAAVRHDRLTGTATYVEPAPGRVVFVRNNCCLFYRIPGGGRCADCVLVPAAAR